MVKAFDQEEGRDATTRNRILEAAATLIAEIGWNQVTTRRIAEQAGVNNALIHYYFGTKEALLFEAATTVFGKEFEGPIARMVEAPTLADGLAGFIDWLRTIEERGPAVIVTIEALLRGLRDEKVRLWIAGTLVDARAMLESLVVAAQQRGELSGDVDAAGTATILAALLDGLLLYRLTDPQLDLEASEAALRGLLGTSPKGRK